MTPPGLTRSGSTNTPVMPSWPAAVAGSPTATRPSTTAESSRRPAAISRGAPARSWPGVPGSGTSGRWNLDPGNPEPSRDWRPGRSGRRERSRARPPNPNATSSTSATTITAPITRMRRVRPRRRGPLRGGLTGGAEAGRPARRGLRRGRAVGLPRQAQAADRPRRSAWSPRSNRTTSRDTMYVPAADVRRDRSSSDLEMAFASPSSIAPRARVDPSPAWRRSLTGSSPVMSPRNSIGSTRIDPIGPELERRHAAVRVRRSREQEPGDRDHGDRRPACARRRTCRRGGRGRPVCCDGRRVTITRLATAIRPGSCCRRPGSDRCT